MVSHIRCFLYLFAKQSINLICTEAILRPVIKARLGAFRIGLRYLHAKQSGTDFTGSIVVAHADVVPDCWSRAYQIHAEPYKHKHKLNPI